MTVGYSYVKDKTHAADSTRCPESNLGTDQVATPHSVFFMPPVFGEFSQRGRDVSNLLVILFCEGKVHKN